MQAPRQHRATDSSSSEYESTASEHSSERDPESAPNSPNVEDAPEPFFEDDDDIPRGENRGKKGLTHEEMAMARYNVGAEDESTQSDSEEELEEPPRSTREQAAESPTNRRDAHIEPVVAKAADLLEDKGLETNAIGYAKLQGAGKGAVDFLVRFQSVTIGRTGFGNDCELKSDAKLVSRQHARLFWDEKIDRWCLTCLSKNGLMVDGTPVASSAPPMPLKSKSLIEIGDVAFFFLLATGTLLRVDDIALLEKKIIQARSMHEEYSEEDEYSDEYLFDRHGPYRISNGAKVRIKKKSRPETGSDRAASRNHRPSQGSAKKGKVKQSEKKETPVEESDYTTSESESEEEEIPDILDDTKYKPMLIPLPSINGKRKNSSERSEGRKRRKKSRSSHAESSGDEYHTASNAGWNKKEKSDFARALFAVGVDPIYDDNGQLTHFSWDRFRQIAGLVNRTDYELEEHYRHFMNDVHTLLDEEEREKRAKGPRTKHKKGCECAVCLNAAKSREKRRALNEENAETEEEREPKSTARPHDKLVGLVTAQKLRVRMGIHEAALQVERDTMQANTVFQKINANRQTTELKDFPEWWIVGYHDKTLMQGVHKHGVGNWENIWYDDSLSRFLRVKEKDGDHASWPSNQAVMKRVRDLSSMIVSEWKRCAKKERDMRKFAKKKERRMMKRRERERQRERQRPERKYEHRPSPPQREADVSTAEESGSEEEGPAAEIETEEEDGFEVEVEEMEILDEGDDGQSFDDQDGEHDTTPVRRGVVAAADDTTDEEEDDDGDLDGHIEAEVEYETASETGSEG